MLPLLFFANLLKVKVLQKNQKGEALPKKKDKKEPKESVVDGKKVQFPLDHNQHGILIGPNAIVLRELRAISDGANFIFPKPEEKVNFITITGTDAQIEAAKIAINDLLIAQRSAIKRTDSPKPKESPAHASPSPHASPAPHATAAPPVAATPSATVTATAVAPSTTATAPAAETADKAPSKGQKQPKGGKTKTTSGSADSAGAVSAAPAASTSTPVAAAAAEEIPAKSAATAPKPKQQQQTKKAVQKGK